MISNKSLNLSAATSSYVTHINLLLKYALSCHFFCKQSPTPASVGLRRITPYLMLHRWQSLLEVHLPPAPLHLKRARSSIGPANPKRGLPKGRHPRRKEGDKTPIRLDLPPPKPFIIPIHVHRINNHCWMGVIAFCSNRFFHFDKWGLVQFPYFAISSSTSFTWAEGILSASIRTAVRK